MDQRLSLITLAVADLAASRAFYIDGLGWEPFLEADDVLMVRTGKHLLLSLWTREGFTAEVGAPMAGGIAPVTLAHNLATDAEVDDVITTMVAAGGTLGEAGTRRVWGGYSGYVLDPDGYRWEIACAGDGPITRTVVP
ncbi:VOC family protein [Nocardioides acrostichi]|uniref:VOC family protein n=1 Tax=Nocardioides acrostichi TaxID=2784339 RepID=A0A930UZ11_9ACTN|nr:VOC family protein [Nocardioides acrostichi]MBF4160189.1 VOC family protein [Nocardioides acrostichi]